MKGLRRPWILILVITTMLTACGFHLRGYTSLPKWLDKIYIVDPSVHKQLERVLASQLKAYGITVCDSAESADYWLIVLDEAFQQNISSVSSSTTPRQYQIIYTAHFKLQKAKGAELIPAQSIQVTRQVTINNNRILGSNYEEEITKNEMRRDASYLILNHLSKLQHNTTVK
jgi:LPS-assembly lipoprotein